MPPVRWRQFICEKQAKGLSWVSEMRVNVFVEPESIVLLSQMTTGSNATLIKLWTGNLTRIRQGREGAVNMAYQVKLHE